MVYESILFVSFILLMCGDHSCLRYWPSNRHCTSTRPKDDGIDPFLAGGPDANGCLYKQFCLSMRSSICSGEKFYGGPQLSSGRGVGVSGISPELLSFKVTLGSL